MASTEDQRFAEQGFPAKCIAVPDCVTESYSHRKIVSHVFGRNKSSTTQIPDKYFPLYCRKHYQRMKFRCQKMGTWIGVQIDLIRKALAAMERWGGVTSWEIKLRKADQARLVAETAVLETDSDGENTPGNSSNNGDNPPPSLIRIISQYQGRMKTYDDLRDVLDVIEAYIEPLDKDSFERRTFPGIEFLPDIDPVRFPSASKRKKAEEAKKKEEEVEEEEEMEEEEEIEEGEEKKEDETETEGSAGDSDLFIHSPGEGPSSPVRRSNKDAPQPCKRKGSSSQTKTTRRSSSASRARRSSPGRSARSQGKQPAAPKSEIDDSDDGADLQTQPIKRRRLIRGKDRVQSDDTAEE